MKKSEIAAEDNGSPAILQYVRLVEDISRKDGVRKGLLWVPISGALSTLIGFVSLAYHATCPPLYITLAWLGIIAAMSVFFADRILIIWIQESLKAVSSIEGTSSVGVRLYEALKARHIKISKYLVFSYALIICCWALANIVFYL